ncbi:hypothetical protein [Helcococcus ovis]|uniref:hypothetical protein n=1 Tax=Helcococcus ovis TaxID=72026 RepID=UPI0038BA9D0E
MKKGKFKLVLSLVAALALFTGCGNNKKEQKSPELKKSELKSVTPVFKEKQNKYKNDKTTEVLVDAEIAKENIVKVVKHGDHWHVWTKDGVEHITYTDPNKLQSGKKLSLVSVVSLEKLKEMDVVKILKHGDHWHVYTSDGSEYLTYENPESSFRNVEIGTYVGNHGNNQYSSENYDSNISEELRGSDVVKILKHEDHYHIYTRDGQEFISYSDPRNMYPNAEFGQYVGSHGESFGGASYEVSKPRSSHKNKIITVKDKNSKLNKLNNTSRKLNLISVENNDEKLKKLDVKEILLHENHYHIYTKDGSEIISYNKNIPNIFKGVNIGKYIGSHGDVPKMRESDWPKGIDRIVDHGDHWHLYKGNDEVAVVRENPKNVYPHAEYIVENLNKNKHIVVTESEKFKYSDVEAKLVESVLPYLDPNLQAMTDFGSLRNAEYPVYGSNNVYDDIFYWLHGNHYHAISIDQIIQNAKAGEYGTNTARDVVATLKYKVENKGTSLEVNYDIDRTDVQKFLMKEYGIKDKLEVYNIGNNFNIYKNGKTITLHLKDFSLKDGKVIYSGKLPGIDGSIQDAKKDYEVINAPNLFKSPEFNSKKADKINKDQGNEDEKSKVEPKKLPNIENKNENYEGDLESSISKKESDNLKKLAKVLNTTEEDVFDFVYEKIPALSRFADLEVNEDGTVKYKGKIYDLRN